MVTNIDNVTGFNKRIGVYKFFNKSIKVATTLINGKEITEERILIMVEQSKNGVKKTVVHPITEFIHTPLKTGGIPSIKTQNQVANYIVNFLNFILIENYHIYKVNNITGLLFEHGTEYLTTYGQTGRTNKAKPIKKSTVQRCEKYLTQLYYFLAKKNVLKHITVKDFDFTDYTYDDLSIKKIPESPFNRVQYPNTNTENDINLIHDIDTELIIPFILTANEYTPRIALGVAFQCFGGLRVGEVVNITTTGITPCGNYGEFGFQIKLQDRNFRPELKSISGNGTVKKKRRQGIFPFFDGKLLQMLYKKHLKKYKATDGSNALFSNTKGQAMPKFTYEYYFNKLKEQFLKKLGESENSTLRNHGLVLKSCKWSTHIGRGIFSNLVAEQAQNILQVMSYRGDTNAQSSLPYVLGTNKSKKKLTENYNDMYTDILKTYQKIMGESEPFQQKKEDNYE